MVDRIPSNSAALTSEPKWQFPFRLAVRDQRVMATLLLVILTIYSGVSTWAWVSRKEEARENWHRQTSGPVISTVEINSASALELELLPGIGPGLAQRLVEDRRDRGPFSDVQDMDRVPGIGPRTIERLRPFVAVELN